jgi:hypothetical protein
MGSHLNRKRIHLVNQNLNKLRRNPKDQLKMEVKGKYSMNVRVNAWEDCLPYFVMILTAMRIVQMKVNAVS